MDIEKLLERIEATPTSATTKTVFGEPMKVGELTIVPVARISGGFGLGFGKGKNPTEKTGEAAEHEGTGGGGGGKVSATPVAVIEITADRVRVKPIVDVNRIVTNALLLVAWNVFWITLTVRAVNRFKHRRSH